MAERAKRCVLVVGVLAGTACGTLNGTSSSRSVPDAPPDLRSVAEAIVDIALDRSSVRLNQPERELRTLEAALMATPEISETDWLGSVSAVIRPRRTSPDGVIRLQLTGEADRLRVMQIDASFALDGYSRDELAELIRSGFEREGVRIGVSTNRPPDFLCNFVDEASSCDRHIQVFMAPTAAVLQVWLADVR